MDLIADILLTAGALSVAFYCFILSRRLSRFTDLEKGVGGAVAVLSAQVDDLNKAVERARQASTGTGDELRALTERADAVARKLEFHVASLHDLPEMDAQHAEVAPARPSSTEKPDVATSPGQAAAPVRSFFSSQRAPAREFG